MRIGGIVRLSTIDWVGHVSTVIFMAGCNFSCPTCHNKQFIPTYSGREIGLEEITPMIINNIPYVDSIVVSGGEPLLQESGLIEIFKFSRKAGLSTMIQTNGSRPEVLKRLINRKLLDYVALDFKTSEEKYHLLGGNPPLKALKILFKLNVDFEIRTTMIPHLTEESDMVYIRSKIPFGIRWVRQKYRES